MGAVTSVIIEGFQSAAPVGGPTSVHIEVFQRAARGGITSAHVEMFQMAASKGGPSSLFMEVFQTTGSVPPILSNAGFVVFSGRPRTNLSVELGDTYRRISSKLRKRNTAFEV